jgi:uncharacterized protein (DUF433 family)
MKAKAAASGIGAMIVRTGGVTGGRPRLAGTRVPVHRVARYYRLGYAPEEILNLLGSLSLPQIHAAIAYALANPEEMEQSIQDEEQTAKHLLPAKPVA